MVGTREQAASRLRPVPAAAAMTANAKRRGHKAQPRRRRQQGQRGSGSSGSRAAAPSDVSTWPVVFLPVGCAAAVVMALAGSAIESPDGNGSALASPGVRIIDLTSSPPAVPPPLRDDLERAQQSHLLRWVDDGTLSAAETKALVAQLQRLRVSAVVAAYNNATAAAAAAVGGESSSPAAAGATAECTPLTDAVWLARTPLEDRGRWERAGLRAIATGSIGVVTLAGGQGTRLGFAGPKGAFQIGLPSNSSLFALFAHRIARLQALATAAAIGHEYGWPMPGGGPTVRWYVMTSPSNDLATKTFFAKHRWFGLDSGQVTFFTQSTMPAFSTAGKILMGSPSSVVESPDGNGALYDALQTGGVLADMAARGVSHVHVHSVDNALGMVADPVMVGFALQHGAGVTNKAVPKTDPTEKTGVLASCGGRQTVLEYTELAAHGEGVGAGTALLANICSHLFSREFLEGAVGRGADQLTLPYHIARKRITHVPDSVQGVAEPVTSDGVKLERFLFEAFTASTSVATLVVERDAEFAPVKNAEGMDSPTTARELVSRAARTQLEAAGVGMSGKCSKGDTTDDCSRSRAAVDPRLQFVEISPLVSYRGEGLRVTVTPDSDHDLSARLASRSLPPPPPPPPGGVYRINWPTPPSEVGERVDAEVYLSPQPGFGLELGRFNLSRLKRRVEGTPGSFGFRVGYGYAAASEGGAQPPAADTARSGAEGGGNPQLHSDAAIAPAQEVTMSPWHDIPLISGVDSVGDPTFNFVCEIPKGSVAKYEIHKSKKHNPVTQDLTCRTGRCALRWYKYPPAQPGSLVNYGALPQTWEDPALVRDDTGEGGDNDPVDVLHLGQVPCEIGQVMPARVVGSFAMVDRAQGGDRGETDWKLLMVPATAEWDHVRDIGDIPAETIARLREWFTNYKTVEGKAQNTFAFGGVPVDKAYALKVVMETHHSWYVSLGEDEIRPKG